MTYIPLVTQVIDVLDLSPAYEWPLKFMTAVTVVAYVLSIITGNVSQVDRVWTFLPTVYTAYFALLPLWPLESKDISPYSLALYTPRGVGYAAVKDYSPRALLMLGLSVLWTFRLSYNTYRRGLFTFTEEDYRWAVLRKQLPAWFFQFTNITFIAIIQNIILFLLGIPALHASLQPHEPLGNSDYILTALALVTMVFEFTADNQQFAYQSFKHSGGVRDPKNEWIGAKFDWTEVDAKRGFITRGLWAWSRHPNFLCEQSFWIIMTLFPVLSPHSPSLPSLPLHSLTPTSLIPLAPALVLCTLFYSSTLFSEAITKSKYTEPYGLYQQRVGMFFPFETVLKGLWLSYKGRKEVVDAAIWGKGKVE